jgi:hypothetical protein
MAETINDGPLLGYHLESSVKVIDDGRVDLSWARGSLDSIIERIKSGSPSIEESVFGLYRDGQLNALEVYVVSPERAEIIWDYRYGPNRFWIFESVSYNRRIVTNFATLYAAVEQYCHNGFATLRTLLDQLEKPSDFRSSFKS